MATIVGNALHRLLAASVMVVAFVAAGSHSASAAPIVSLSSPATVTDGQVFSVHVDVSDVVDLYAFQLTVTFDPLLLTALEVLEGSLLSNTGPTIFFPGFIDNVTGVITFAANTLTGPVGADGDGTLFSVQFMANGTGAAIVGTFADDANGDGLLDSSLASIPDATLTAQRTITIRTPDVAEPGTLSLLALGVTVAASRRRVRRSGKGGRP
jgi:hypothetical protein